jgi:ATP-dependent helicase/nuclease subunit A
MEELAAQPDRARSAFIVGDDKQSIYGFRRADARLLDAAGEWMSDNLSAGHYSMDKSRRSSPAIMNFVNRLFLSPPLNDLMPSFQEHSTVHDELLGAVVLLPLIVEEPKEEISLAAPLRNPLHTPRANDAEENRFLREGRLIAEKIKQLKQSFGRGKDREPLRYNDIMLLLRTRSHLVHFENALREAHIPYVSGGKTSLLDSRAVKDITDLLQILITPYYDLGLATVLRSPLFACTDNDLILVAQSAGKTWHEKLASVVERVKTNDRLLYAYHRIEEWRALAGKLPVHDLLDKIYCDADLTTRYQAAYPPHLRAQVRRQLQELLALALEVDSGRYPTVGRFLAQLKEIRLHDNDSVGDASPAHVDAVQVMTIHAAKGLEAAVVFLADAAEEPKPKAAFSSLVAWPADAEKPQHFLLLGKKEDVDEYSSQLLHEKNQREKKENANLLYVAITRAKQLLFISGSKTDKKKDDKLGWYGLIQMLGDVATDYLPEPETAPLRVEPNRNATMTCPPPFDTRLNASFAVDDASVILNPSQTTDSEYRDIQAQQRGQTIHRFLQLLTQGHDAKNIMQQVAFEQKLPLDTAWLTPALNEAKQVIAHPAFRTWFDSQSYENARNELPMYYRDGERVVMGIVDRVVIFNDHAILIDYKTHRLAENAPLDNIAAEYWQQMQCYWQGAKKLWPNKKLQAFLVFTSTCRSYEYLDFETENVTV